MLWFVCLISILVTYVFFNYFFRSLKVGDFGRKYVLITGCDTGFGRYLAIRLDKLGFRVFATCLSSESCRSLSELCSDRVKPMCLDVGQTDSIATALSKVEQQLSQEDASLWAVVNNAEISGVCDPIEMCRTQDFLDCLEVNLFGPMEVIRHFLPLLRKSQGRVVNMVSIMGRVATGQTSCYTTSKFGVEGYSDILRREIYRQGVKVSMIEPGFYKTGMLNDHEKIRADLDVVFQRSPAEIQECYGADCMDRLMYLLQKINENGNQNPDEVINAYVHALSSRFPHTRYVVGKDARFIFIPMSYLPDWFTDPIFSFGLKQVLKMGGYDVV